MTMPVIEALLRQPAAQAMAWALFQFVWQGAAIGALTALALLTLRRGAADVRYVVAAISLGLMLTLPIVTGVQKYEELAGAAPISLPVLFGAAKAPAVGRAPAAASASPSGQYVPSESAVTRSLATEAALIFDRMLPSLMLAWLAGVAVLSLRLLTGWLWIQRLRTRGVSAADAACRRLAARLSRRLHISRVVTLLDSTLVDVPTVIGFVKPVVLLPASALGGLTPQQLEAILAHELAHIRRHDYLVNLLQTLVETVLFYHPAVWWVSRRIRVERENCCDDLAVSLCGDPVAYATALADLEALRSGPAPDHHIAMAATGGSLLHRVRRLLGAPSSHTGRAPAWLAGGVALVLLGGIAAGAAGRPQEQVVASTGSTLESVPVPAAPAAPPAPPARPARAARHAPGVPPPAEAPAPPAAAALPAQAAPPAPPAPASQSISVHTNDSTGTWSWSHDGEKLEVKYSGRFAFTDDDSDVKEISPGGYIKISDGAWLGRHSVEIRERNGQLERHYYVNLSERPYEPDGRVWLHQNLPNFIRNTGIGAPARVARFLKSGGVPGVMGEIGRIGSTYVKGIYYRELFRQATLTPEQYRQVMVQASTEMRSSSYELAQLLIAIADRLPSDEASRAAYFNAAASIDSDYELRRVYSTMLKRGPVSAQVLAGILDHSTSIDSDYELSELLRQILSQQPLDERNRAAFFRTVATIDSDYERHRVLSAAVGGQRPSDPAVVETALQQAAGLGSDYEAASFLLEVLRQNAIEGSARGPFFRVVSGLDSGYERGRVLQAVVKRPDASTDTLQEVLRSAKGMSGYELSQVLQAVASTHVLSGSLRDAYLDAAERLSGYEQNQALAALVRSERKK